MLYMFLITNTPKVLRFKRFCKERRMKKTMQALLFMFFAIVLVGCQKKEVLAKRPTKKSARVTRKASARKKNVKVQSAGKAKKGSKSTKNMLKKPTQKKAVRKITKKTAPKKTVKKKKAKKQ